MESQVIERRRVPRLTAQWSAWMTLQASGSHYYATSKDVSATGAHFAGPLLVEPKEALQLSFRNDAMDLPIQCAGMVRWSRLGNDGQWHFGVEFCGLGEPASSRLARMLPTH